MDPTEYAALARRLIDNPQDAEALAAARRLGLRDAGTYALLLEKVGHGSDDRRAASHWFTEAAAVWSTTLGDIRRTELVLREALRADPWNDRAAERLAQLLEVSADPEALLATLEGRAAACASRCADIDDGASRASDIFLQLAKRLSASRPPRPDRALAAFEHAMALNPANRDAIRGARGLYASARRWADVSACFEKERALLHKPADTLRTYREEAALLKAGGDSAGAVRALRFAYALDDTDLEVAEELANAILGRVKSGGNASKIERAEASELFLSLAETYDGEMALSHVLNALRANPGSDVAIDLAFRLAGSLGHEAMLTPFAVAYLAENPRGLHAVRVRFALARAHESAGRVEDAIRVLSPIEKDNEDAASKVLALVQKTGKVDDIVARMDAQAVALPPGSRFQILLESARVLERAAREDEALKRYEQVLALNPAHPEALDKITSRLRARGERTQLRDMLKLAAAHASTQPGTRRAQLREAAELSVDIGDREQACDILFELYEANRNDDAVRDLLKRVLVEMKRWDDVVKILDREIGAARSADKLVAVLREQAEIHEHGRGDLVGAANSWARIAKLSSDDDSAMFKAVGLFEKADCIDEAISLLSSGIMRVPEAARPSVFARISSLAETRGQHLEAAEAAASRAALTEAADDWKEAERLFALAGAWPQAVVALDRQQGQTGPAERATTLARKADYLARAGELDAAVDNLEQAFSLVPFDAYLDQLQKHAETSGKLRRFVEFALQQAERVEDKETRVSLLRRSARALRDTLADAAGALDVQRKLLLDRDDAEALSDLAEDADRKGDYPQACELLLRLEGVLSEPADRLRILLRVARLRFDRLDDAPAAIELLERALLEVDGASVEALEESVRMREATQDWPGVVTVLERAKARSSTPQDKLAFELRLAQICEQKLGDSTRALDHLRAAHALDPANRGTVLAVARLHEERAEWKELADTLTALLSSEPDEQERVSLVIRRATLIDEKLGHVDDALAELEPHADQGDRRCREAYVAIADRAGRKGSAAAKLELWSSSDAASAASQQDLCAAMDRYLECGMVKEAGQVLARLGLVGAAEHALASRLEDAALASKDIDVAQAAQGFLMAGRDGRDRALEAIRQAEALASAGASRSQVILAAEAELSALASSDVAPLLSRLAELAPSPEERLSLFERQVARSGDRAERIAAISVAAGEAARLGLMERCQRLLAMGVATAAQDDDLLKIEEQVKAADDAGGGRAVRRVWAEALVEGASASRLPTTRRAELLRRAGRIAYRDLDDPAQAFDWFNEAMFVRIGATLDILVSLQGEQLRDVVEAVASVGRRLDALEARLPSRASMPPAAPPPLPLPKAPSPESAARDAAAPRLSEKPSETVIRVDLVSEDGTEVSEDVVLIDKGDELDATGETRPRLADGSVHDDVVVTFEGPMPEGAGRG